MATSVRPLCTDLTIKAQRELSETPKKLEEGIQHLKDWISKRPHLRARTDDQWLAAFLRGCKYSLERTKEKMDLFYTMRSIAPEMSALKYDDSRFHEIVKSGFGVVLPKRAHPADPRVVLLRASQYDASRLTILDVIAVTQAIQMISHMEDDAFVIAGVVLIFDLNGLNMSQFAQLTPAIMKKAIVYAQDASPIRLKEAHFIGLPAYLHSLFKVTLQFLNEKNRRKMHLHNENEIQRHISKDILPYEYGGNGGKIQEIIDCWMDKVVEYEMFWKEDVQFGTDETKRPGKPKTADSLFGVDGSFRQLDFD